MLALEFTAADEFSHDFIETRRGSPQSAIPSSNFKNERVFHRTVGGGPRTAPVFQPSSLFAASVNRDL